MLENIPAELKALPQWVSVDMSINSETGQPRKWPIDPKTGRKADVTDPSTWGTFEQCRALGKPQGFVFTEGDPYAIIDLDNKPHKPATPNQLEVHNQILAGVESYIERSISVTGYHVVIRGSIPAGINFGNVELYSSGRYMIFTGDVVKNLPIDDYNEAINNMYQQMLAKREENRQVVELEQIDGYLEDGDIFTMGSEAVNGSKFNALCRGDWQHFGFPSQSEADLALMSMFTFYSKDNEQCRRLFRMTELGKRDKYQNNNNHLDRMLMMARSKETQNVDIEAMEEQVAEIKANLPPTPPLEVPRAPTVPFAPKVPDSIRGPMLSYLTPPGILATMADYMYTTANRQVREYAVCSAIAMFAGLVSRTYNVSRTGLNLYIIMLGATGSGKEGGKQAIDRLEKFMNDGLTEPKSVDLGSFSSIQGLQKALVDQPYGLTIIGEVGMVLKSMLNDKTKDGNAVNLKKAYLDLFNKSGETDSLAKVTYSKEENKLDRIQSPNLSILGESVPHRFYEAINEVTAEDGFVSRLMVVEYGGLRNDHNDNNTPPPDGLVKTLCAIRDYCADMAAKDLTVHIPITPEANAILSQYDKDITVKMNKATMVENHAIAALLNRSHLKAWRLAGLGAVAVSPYTPVITVPLIEWAIDFVNRADAVIISRFEKGEVGEVGDNQFELVIRKCVTSYFKMTPTQRKNGRQPESMLDSNFIGYSFIRDYCKRREPFKSHKLGTPKAIEVAMKDMIDAGILVPVPDKQLPGIKNGHTVKAYAVGSQFLALNGD